MRRRRRGSFRRQRPQLEVVEPHRALSPATRGDREFECRDTMQRATARRTPRERDVTALDGFELPGTRKLDIAPVAPPHVGTRRIDELQLEIVGAALAPQAKRETVAIGQLERHVAVQYRISATLHELEVHPQRLARNPLFRRQFHLDTIGRHGLPGGRRFERVDHLPGGRFRVRGSRGSSAPGHKRVRCGRPSVACPPRRTDDPQQQHTHGTRTGRSQPHPFTLPIITPRR